MDPVEKHQHLPKVSFDGGDLDCGNGLLLLIRKNLDPLDSGELMEVRSSDTSVEEDLPAWCRLTGNELVSWTKSGRQRSYLIRRGVFAGKTSDGEDVSTKSSMTNLSKEHAISEATAATRHQSNIARKTEPKAIAPLSVMGVGSWPRPLWLIPYLHQYLENKISEEQFDRIADDAVKLSVQAQIQAGVSVLSDGEARRDNYASFVGSKLNGCQLIPLTDLLPLVDDPEKFKSEMQSLDVPAEKVRHPAVFGRLSRKKSIAVNELQFLASISDAPIKVAIPGPYLLTRLMWMDCITDKVYQTREELSQDVIAILREELNELLEEGASIVQLDEPVLTEVVFTGAKNTRSFMCGALSERGHTEEELKFASSLINAVCQGFPKERIAMHVCRGNWTPDENMALAGDYSPLLPLFNQLEVGRLILEFCTPRAGDLHVLKNLRKDIMLGLGVLNPKTTEVESIESILKQVRTCIELIGINRITLNPDCGFATFADNPVNSAEIATAKLASAVKAAAILRTEYGL